MQGVAGFAYSLLAVPLLMLVGFELPDAVMFSLLGSMATRLLVVQHCRHHVKWKLLWSMVAFCAVGLVIGVFFLKQLNTLPSATVRQYIGAIILLTVAMRLFVKIEPGDSVASIWRFIAAFFFGIFGGTANIGEPPLVLWVVAHKWSTECTRAIILFDDGAIAVDTTLDWFRRQNVDGTWAWNVLFTTGFPGSLAQQSY